jgi:hypothetical protein
VGKRGWAGGGACRRNLVDVGGKFLFPKGTASPARAKLLSMGVSETRSHAVGQSLDKRTL